MRMNFREAIFKCSRSVFKLRDIGMLTGATDADNLKAAANYYVSRGVIRNIRKGIYVKDSYSVEELACRLYSPSYISLETVLRRAGIIFQYSSEVTAVSYLSRTVTVDGNDIAYQKIKDSVLVESRGVEREGNVNVAIPERAFLDRLYLSKDYYFDNVDSLDRDTVDELLDIYGCKALEKRVRRSLRNA
jgi:hypothetical protein